MTSAKRFRIAIISAIVLAVLLIAACFSVSYAKWGSGDTASQATSNGTVGQFYVDVPAQDALPELDEDTYYLKVDNNSSEPAFYPFTTPADNECSLILELAAGDTITVYKGKTVVSDLTRDWAVGDDAISEIINGSFTIKQSTIHRFYYKIGFADGGKDALYVGCDPHLSFTFSGGQTVDAIISYDDGIVGTAYLWLWTSAKNYTGGTWPGYTLADLSSGNSKIDASINNLNYASNGLTFLISFHDNGSEQSRTENLTFNT
ncbi:MAG: hypothetical protein K2M48_07030, partial [Clostridiales bacterium]|nr:hypothetical protein [Clostridiales bacterium]